MVKLGKIAFLVGFSLLLFLSGYSSWSQLPEEQQDLIGQKENTYLGINAVLLPFGRDTTTLQAFIASATEADYFEGLAYAYNQLGINARNTSEYPRALYWHGLALAASEKCSNIDFKILSLNMLGVVNRRQEEVRAALDYHKQALELAESSGKTTETNLRSIAVARNSIGNIYISLRQPDLAIAEFSASIEIEEQIGNTLGLAINHQNLGGIFEEKGEYEKALESYQKSLAFNEEIDSDLGRLICHNSIGQVYLKQNRISDALQIIQPTIQKAIELGDQYYLAMARTNLGWVFLEQGALRKSEIYLNQALEVARERNIGYYVSESYRLLGEISERRGDYKAALAFSKLHTENEERYLNEQNQQYMADLISRYDSDRKRNRIGILEKENELVNQKLAHDRNIFTVSFICISLLGLLFYILNRQNNLKNEKEILALEQTMMRSQMNPHFIFNSLNSIKLYIISNNKEKAVFYLNKFSKLIRTILATSKEKDITLKEELDTMQLYMNIENIRFSSKIHFSLDVEKGIDTKAIKIPSMVLQPFLENAIWHGLSAKEGDKTITLNVQRSSESEINIEITDNGVGREKSKEIKAHKTIKHKSIGIGLTEQRLQNYFNDLNEEHSLEIKDLYDDENNAIGTKVILIIPIVT